MAATAARGETRLIHAGRLRYKESDRLKATAELIRSLGGQVRELPDQLIIQGSALTGGTVQSFSDHRIVMAAAIAATVAQGPVTILGAEAVRKSYPDFFNDYQSLGGNVHVL
ncbi:3-phosphoshikimate 1-carboxyvinyltransferase [bioreactor metagenome]|uniref:3-phosphoshikimate 1-carboxyvinyltransferase n=1 Tax=bioreactor metagenome TaxID=1076179 RepID=A0A645HK76_9ZZZZ